MAASELFIWNFRMLPVAWWVPGWIETGASNIEPGDFLLELGPKLSVFILVIVDV